MSYFEQKEKGSVSTALGLLGDMLLPTFHFLELAYSVMGTGLNEVGGYFLGLGCDFGQGCPDCIPWFWRHNMASGS